MMGGRVSFHAKVTLLEILHMDPNRHVNRWTKMMRLR